MSYLRRVEEEAMDKIYSRGYEKAPKKEDISRAQVGLVGNILS